jgi:hypothetical protein
LAFGTIDSAADTKLSLSTVRLVEQSLVCHAEAIARRYQLGVWSTTPTHEVTNDAVRDIRSVAWVADSTHLLYLQHTNGDQIFHVYALDCSVTETRARDLTPGLNVKVSSIVMNPHYPHEILLSTNQRNTSHFDVDRGHDIRHNGTDLECATGHDVLRNGTVGRYRRGGLEQRIGHFSRSRSRCGWTLRGGKQNNQLCSRKQQPCGTPL